MFELANETGGSELLFRVCKSVTKTAVEVLFSNAIYIFWKRSMDTRRPSSQPVQYLSSELKTRGKVFQR